MIWPNCVRAVSADTRFVVVDAFFKMLSLVFLYFSIGQQVQNQQRALALVKQQNGGQASSADQLTECFDQLLQD